MAFEGFHSLTAHADYVTVTTTSRSNFIFDGDLVSGNARFSLNKSTATSYQVRNYDGDLIASGSLNGSSTRIDVPDTAHVWRGTGPRGWYRGYLFGPDLGTGWGTAYGDWSYYRVSTNAAFPTNPVSATAASGDTSIDEIARGVMALGTPRYTANLSTIIAWSNVNYATASGTSVTLTPGAYGNGPRPSFVHVFIGDPSELATPTTSVSSMTWTNEARVTKNTLTMTFWTANNGSGGDFGIHTFSSGTKSGTHYLYAVNIWHADWAQTHACVTDSGTGTSGAVTVPAQSYPAGRQKLVQGMVATASGVTFGSWPTNFSTTAWSRTTPGVQPTAPNSIFSVASNVYNTDTSTNLTVTWSASRDYVMIGIPLCSEAASGLPTTSAALMQDYWGDYALSGRTRKSVINFPDGSHDRFSLVADAVTAFAGLDAVFEPYNEPIFTLSAADYVTYELAPFYAAATAADPTARVLGIATVSYNRSNAYIEDFFAAGGAAYCTDISVHDYNAGNGDLPMSKRNLQWLIDRVSGAGALTKPLWQTEQGHPVWYAGQVWPRYAARWTALQFFVGELYGISAERNHYWYDLEHGFDAYPEYWTSTWGPGPQALPIRTQVAEIGARAFTAQLDFGSAGNLYAGGTWTHADTSKTIAFVASSFGQPSIRFATNAVSLVAVDCWGNTTTLTASGGFITVPSSELPTYIRVPAGSTCTLNSRDWVWGFNACNGATASTTVSSSAVPVTRVNDGEYQNQYEYSTASLTHASAPWNDAATSTTFPKNLTVTFTQLRSIERFVIVCTPPWQGLTTLLDFDIEAQAADNTWSVIYTHSPPASTSFFFKSVGRCTAETFYNQQSTWIYKPGSPVPCKAFRLVVRATTYGPHESTTYNNNGQVGGTDAVQKLMVSELQAFYGSNVPAPTRRVSY